MEQPLKKNRIVICELYHEYLHGKDNAIQLNGQYVVIDTFNNFYEETDNESLSNTDTESNDSDGESEEEDDPLYEEDNYEILTLCIDLHREKYQEMLLTPHFISSGPKIIRNYMNMIRNPLYIQPQIAECYHLKNRECVCVLKTFWIRLVQRTWKRIYKERKDIFQRRRIISSLKHGEINGRWPDGLNVMPSVYGMLDYLNHH
jgi:hypothetical protein